MAGGRTRCCAGCAVREGWVVSEFIRRGLSALPPKTWVCFLTLTEPGEARSVQDHAAAVSAFLRELWPWLDARSVTPRKRPYVGVREFQKRGAVHTHLLIAFWPRVDLGELSALAARHGLGHTSTRGTFQLGGRNVTRSGESIRDLSLYLGKTFGGYLSKGFDEYDRWLELMPPGYRVLHHGGGWAEGLTLQAIRDERLGRVRLRHGDKTAPAWSEQDALDLLRRELDVQVLDVVPNLSG